MESKKFSDVAAKETDEKLTIREGNLYSRKKIHVLNLPETIHASFIQWPTDE